MKLLILIVFSTACTTSSQQVPGSVKFIDQDPILRRQGVSYSTSIVHQNPKYPDQHAQSSIKVDLHPQKIKLKRQPLNQANNPYQIYNIPHKRPKVLQPYSHNNLQLIQNIPQQPYQLQLRQPQPQYAVEEKPQQAQATQLFTNVQNPSFNPEQSQSFNVGYSVSFTGDSKPQIPRSFARQRLETAEIITGSRKDVVQKPNSEFEANDFVTNAFIDLKKQKVSGIKPKLHKFPSGKESDAKSFISNLAPKTQQFLSYLGEAKPISSSNNRFRQQLETQSSDVQNTKVLRGHWTNLSPSVEIYHSKESKNYVFNPKEQLEQSKNFDHAGALGKSQGFDYSNALEGQTDKSPQRKPEKNQQNFLQTQVSSDVLGHSGKDQQNLLQAFPDFKGNVEASPFVIPYANGFESLPVEINLSNVQIPQKSQDLSLLQTQKTGIPLKLPINLALVRDPILSTSGSNLPNDPHTLAIPFDTTLLQAMQQKLLTSAQPSDGFDANKGQVQVLQGNVGNAAGPHFQTQLENLQVQPLQGINQDTFHDQGFQEFQGQQLQQTQQFNVYGSPQHALFLKKDFDQYFDQTFDGLQPQESRFESLPLRHPQLTTNSNFNNNNSNRLRTTKEIHTVLQPPPMQIARHRRMFIG